MNTFYIGRSCLKHTAFRWHVNQLHITQTSARSIALSIRTLHPPAQRIQRFQSPQSTDSPGHSFRQDISVFLYYTYSMQYVRLCWAACFFKCIFFCRLVISLQIALLRNSTLEHGEFMCLYMCVSNVHTGFQAVEEASLATRAVFMGVMGGPFIPINMALKMKD